MQVFRAKRDNLGQRGTEDQWVCGRLGETWWNHTGNDREEQVRRVPSCNHSVELARGSKSTFYAILCIHDNHVKPYQTQSRFERNSTRLSQSGWWQELWSNWEFSCFACPLTIIESKCAISTGHPKRTLIRGPDVNKWIETLDEQIVKIKICQTDRWDEIIYLVQHEMHLIYICIYYNHSRQQQHFHEAGKPGFCYGFTTLRDDWNQVFSAY